MKFQIKHECRGRIRVQMAQARMTMEQADLLEAWLQTLPDVERAVVHERTRCAVIEYDGNRRVILDALKRFSYQNKALDQLAPIHSTRALTRAYEEKLVGMVAFKAFRTFFFPAPLRAAYTVFRSIPYLFRTARCLLRRQLRVEVLDGISVGLSMVRREFDTAGSVMFLLGLGELLEEWTHKKSVDDLARSMSLNIDRVWLKTADGEVLTPLHQIQAGDQVAVRMGSMIPLDGTIIEGEVMVNQASLTGESIPVAKRPGSSVYAGTVVEEGECVLTVTQHSGQGRYDKIVAMIEESEQFKSAAESQAAHWADKLVPYTLAGSALVYLLTRNVTRAMSVLMVDFSCALKLSMPLAVLSAMGEASRFHATVKGGKYLEAMAQADTVVFDKTGTLTYASPVVAQVIPFGGKAESEMLRLAACLEEHFPHSMANAVVQAAKERGLSHDAALRPDLYHLALTDAQVLLPFQGVLHVFLVPPPVCLGPEAPHRRPFALVQQAVLNAARVRGLCHLAPQSVQLPDQVALAGTADGGVAGHIAHRVQVDGEHDGLHPQPRGGQRR